MPLLARMLPSPLVIEVRAGAIGSLGGLLADHRIATEGRVAVAVAPIGAVDWVEVDDHRDLQRAREIARRC